MKELSPVSRRSLLSGSILIAAGAALAPVERAFAHIAAPAQIPAAAPHEPTATTRKPRLASMVPDVITQGIEGTPEIPIRLGTLPDGRIGTGPILTDFGAIDLTLPPGPQVLNTGSLRLLTDPARIPEEFERKFAVLISPPDFRLVVSVGGRGTFYNPSYGDSLFDLTMFLERYDGRGDVSQAGLVFSVDMLTTHKTVPYEYSISWGNLEFNRKSITRRNLDFDKFEDLVSP